MFTHDFPSVDMNDYGNAGLEWQPLGFDGSRVIRSASDSDSDSDTMMPKRRRAGAVAHPAPMPPSSEEIAAQQRRTAERIGTATIQAVAAAEPKSILNSHMLGGIIVGSLTGGVASVALGASWLGASAAGLAGAGLGGSVGSYIDSRVLLMNALETDFKEIQGLYLTPENKSAPDAERFKMPDLKYRALVQIWNILNRYRTYVDGDMREKYVNLICELAAYEIIPYTSELFKC